jgi:Arylsulfotransferase (ASST)
VARLALLAAMMLVLSSGCGGGGRRAAGGLHTLPGVVPPRVRVDISALTPVGGYVFVAPKGGGKARPGGPLIVDDKGRAVWFHQLPPKLTATDFRVQTYRGKPVLTWWQGLDDKSGIGYGEDVIYDSSYHRIATVKAGNGLLADLHEFQLTPRGTAFITAYRTVPHDLSSVGGPKKSYVFDCIVEEIDVASGKVVFSWDSLDHVPLSESLEANQEPARDASKHRPLDYFHVNSVSDGPNGTILVSARNTSTIYLLARDGHIIWRLGGSHSDFGPKSAVRFFYQHDARYNADGTVSLFDNGGIPRAEKTTRPLVLRLDEQTKRAKVVRTLVPASPIASPYEGNLQLLPGGGAFVGWGGVPLVTDFDRHGRVVFQLRLPFGDSYRAYLEPWSGDPGGRPLVALAGNTVYASWNGKVGIARWEILGGKDANHLTRLETVAWSGLETAIPLPSRSKVIEVRALAAGGRVLGASTHVSR